MIIPMEYAQRLPGPDKVELRGRVRDLRSPDGVRLRVGRREYYLPRQRT